MYLLFYAAVGSQMPFLPLFFSEQGYSTERVGILMGLQGLAVLVAPGISAHIADTLKGGAKSVAIFCNLLGAFFLFLVTISSNFYFSAFCVLGFGLFFVPLFSLVDGIAVALLKKQDNGSLSRFASFRVFGTIGFIAPAIILAPSFFYFHMPYQYALYMSMGFALLDAVVIYFFIDPAPEDRASVQRPPLLEGFYALRREPLITFTLINFLIAIAMGTYYSFFSIHLHALGLQAHSIGVIYNLGPFFEIFFLLFGGWLLSKFGIKKLVLFAALAGVARFGILALSTSTLWICVSMMAHAPIIMSLSVLSNIVLPNYSEPHYRYSVLGLTQVLNGGIARLLGGLAGGFVGFLGIPAENEVTFAFLFGAALCAIATVLSFRLKIAE